MSRTNTWPHRRRVTSERSRTSRASRRAAAQEGDDITSPRPYTHNPQHGLRHHQSPELARILREIADQFDRGNSTERHTGPCITPRDPSPVARQFLRPVKRAANDFRADQRTSEIRPTSESGQGGELTMSKSFPLLAERGGMSRPYDRVR